MKQLIRISSLARADLKNIARYTMQHWGQEQRNDYLSRLDKKFQALLNNPEMGQCCDNIRQGYRRFRESEHVIFYRPMQHGIDIIRILHKSMDIEIHL